MMWRLWIAAAVVCGICVAGWLTYASGKKAGAAVAQQQWDKERAATAQSMANEVQKAREREQALQANVDQIQAEKRHEIANLNRRHAAILDSLRERPERPSGSGVPEAPGAGDGARGCTGAELYRQDAAVALGIARDADELRLALRACQAAYGALMPVGQ